MSRLVALAGALVVTSTACAANTTPSSEATVVDLDAKADTALGLDIDALELFRFGCDLARCDHRLELRGVPDGTTLTFVTGSIDDVMAYRDATLRGDAPGVSGLRVDSVVAEDRRAVFYTTFEGMGTEHEVYALVHVEGVASADLSSVEAMLRVVPDLEAATQIPQHSVGTYLVSSVVDRGHAHRWKLPIEDIFDFFDPEAHVGIIANTVLVYTSVYYQCSSDGETHPVEHSRLTALSEEFVVGADCTGFDDGGNLYVEIRGEGAYEVRIDIL